MAPPTGSVNPGKEVFTDADLAPSADELRAIRLQRIDKVAVIVAVSAFGLWTGGMIALGACAAPMVFEHTPYPFSGRAMGAAFARFDSIAIGCAVVALACEVVRTLVAMRTRRAALLSGGAAGWLPRIRRYGAIVVALGAVYGGMRLTPAIMQLHEQGARRHIGADGERLEQLHKQAEAIGKLTVPLALGLIALHVLTLRSPRPEDEDEDEDAPAPLPPGPRRLGPTGGDKGV